ncbi:hypothetical protein SAMN05421504_10896 [Amycolatopsis xylanica]|uniref:Uncharacterized protein n=1 Tax=Amycolatopsis xylanica TaxID=589385 RepID=A0A1H3P9R3_9PSEU|nr:hypothetical protein [Amycolatopsis xylanica]SDY97856.1 hypothetical protein SAMN05421504_10896 [Amycolatopsis xylanica]
MAGDEELVLRIRDAIKRVEPGLRRLMAEHVRLTVENGVPVVGTELAAVVCVPVADVDRRLARARRATHEAITRALIAEGSRAEDAESYGRWALGPGLLELSERDGPRRAAALALLKRRAGVIQRAGAVTEFARRNPRVVRRSANAAAGVIGLLVVGAVLVLAPHADRREQGVLAAPPGEAAEPIAGKPVLPEVPTAAVAPTGEPAPGMPYLADDPPRGVVAPIVPPAPTAAAPPPEAPAPPPARKWGYARVDNEYGQPLGAERPMAGDGVWGTWQKDAGQAGRKVTLTHLAAGEYRVRLPGVAAEDGVAHVTVNHWAAGAAVSCGVRETTPDGDDQLITVTCRSETAPADVGFDIFFAQGSAGDVRPDATAVRHAGPGRYLVPPMTGYAQVTPYGDGHTRCQVVSTVEIACHAIETGAAADSDWRLGSVRDLSFLQNGTSKQLAAGVYAVGFRGVARGDVLQVTTLGSRPGYCRGVDLISAGFGGTLATVFCVDSAGKPADLRFGVAIVRRPVRTESGFGAIYIQPGS